MASTQASTQASPSETGSLDKHLICSICMDQFVDPVTTPCGHSFCKKCLDCSININDRSCPLCKAHQNRTPEVNIVLRDILKQISKKDDNEYTGAPGEVACDVCTERKLKAEKSCLVCLASYCSTHLENHSSAERLKGHKLVEPVENLDERACLQHGRPLELYSRKKERCICVRCMEDSQEEVVPTEDEWDNKKVGYMYFNPLWYLPHLIPHAEFGELAEILTCFCVYDRLSWKTPRQSYNRKLRRGKPRWMRSRHR